MNTQEHSVTPELLGRRDTVLLVANYESDVGYAWWLMENFWAVIACEMAKKKRPCFLAYPIIRSIPEIIREAPVEVIEATVRRKSFIAALRSAALMRRLHVRSVYLSDWPSFSYVYALWRLAGVQRIVLHYHTFSEGPDPRGPRAWVKAAVHRVRLVSCDTYVGVSDYIHQRFIDNWKVPAQRCVAVKNGIREFSCEETDRPAMRQLMGIPPDAVIVALVGRASVHKGWQFALHCLRRLHADPTGLPPVHFVYCGDGPDLEKFRKLAAALNLTPFAHFLGRRSDVRCILCASDFAFHPSRGEAMSLAILEFMCAGLPVVAPDIRSVCQTIRNRQTGMVYKANDEFAAVAALKTLVLDPVLRLELGRAARADLLSNYRLELTNESLIRNVVPRL